MATDDDRMVGENVARLRGDMTQQALADAMRERGWKWSQATVWSGEKGERPLRLLEAEDLSQVLSCAVSDFTSKGKELQVEMDVRAAAGDVSRSYDLLKEAVKSLEGDRGELAYWLRLAERMDRKIPESLMVSWQATRARKTPDEALREALQMLAPGEAVDIDGIIDETQAGG